MLNQYKTVDGKQMRMGYTTGSCAAAAAKAGAIMLATQKAVNSVCLITPKGIELTLDILDIELKENSVSCAVKKDAGDDPDVTDGLLVYATVEKTTDTDVIIDGGVGVGRVTKPGLNQSVGSSAINTVPRHMIKAELKQVIDNYNLSHGFKAVISVPLGEITAQKTFNSRLGIVGGISILGTSGIVEPMSDNALIETIKAEIDVQRATGKKYLLITPGNYGKEFISSQYNFEDSQSVKCSNFIGVALEYAAECNFKGVLLIGHLGKMVKLAGGMFNTHSRYGDCRGEIIAANAILCGLDTQTAQNILNSATVDEMLFQIKEEKIRKDTLNLITQKIYMLTNRRVYDRLQVETVIYTQKQGFLSSTPNALNMAQKIKEQL